MCGWARDPVHRLDSSLECCPGYTPFKRPKTFVQFVSLVVSIACIALHFLEFVIQPPAQYPDLFPVLNVLINTPVFGLVWLWSIESGIEVGWVVFGSGGSNPVAAHSSSSSQSIQPPSNTNLTSVTSPKVSYFHSIHRGDPGSPFSATDSPLSLLHAFNRLATRDSRTGVKEQTWFNASANSNVGTRGTLPVGPGRDRVSNLEGAEGTDGGGETSIQGPELNLNLGVQGQNLSDKRRSRGQSVGASKVRKRVSTFPGSVEGPPLSFD